MTVREEAGVRRLPELQEAVRALDGVAAATVRWADPSEPATLHVTFAAGTEHGEVAAAVLAALERVAEVGPGGLEIDAIATSPGLPPAPVQVPSVQVPHVAAPSRAARPVFSGLAVERTDLDAQVTVTLRFGGRTATASAEGLATRRSTPRTAASAALRALRDFLPRDTRVQLEWLEVVESASPSRPDVVHAAVTCLTPAGEETYLGTAMVRADLREAAVRAALDALNRRLQDLVPQAV